jgi:hypothetical protein
MPSREDCLDEIARKSGRKRAEVNDLLEQILDRAEAYESDGLPAGEAYQRARDEMLANLAQQSALDRRAAIMDRRKDIERARYYDATAKAIEKLPAGKKMLARLKLNALRFAFEAKLVGVNVPFFKGRLSVDAQYVALRRLWIGGFARDLDQSGLLKIFASRAIEDKWIDELFELNKKPSAAWQRATDAGGAGEREAWELAQRGQGPGRPGVTKDAQALAIARIVQKWQKQGMAALNREGAWIRSYSGYITRTAHDADKIRRAGQEKWIADTIPKLDLVRTFGTRDMQRARDALRAMFTPMSLGDHFDYGRPVEEPLYPTPAKTASASRELHFKSGQDWREYNAQYGVHNATHTVVEAMRIAARRTALIKEFGTRARESYESDKQMLLDRLKKTTEGQSSRLGALEQAYNSAAAGSAERAKLEPQMAALRTGIGESQAQFDKFKSWLQAFDNRFAQIDGTSQKPVNRTASNVVAGIMSVQRTSKLGNLFATHFASLPSKTMEARYWGIPFAKRFASLISGLTSGIEGSAKREAIDATLVGFEHRLGHILNAYDVADAPAGYLTQAEETFFKLTGVNAVIDNQRGDFEAMAAAHIGGKRELDWDKIGAAEQRVLQGFGLGEREWKALKGVEWSKLDDGRTYLFPSDALKLSDDQVKAYLKEGPALDRAEPNADDLAQAREQLAMQLAAAYTDRSGYAIPMPSARTRAILFGKDFEQGTAWNLAKKLFFQFKLWPIDMINRAWGREIYGRIGDGRLDRVAGLVETLVAATVFGVGAESLRDLVKGQNPIAKIEKHPLAAILAGAQRSGMGSIVGDYLLGQFDRHGLSAAANLLGPTFGQVDDLMTLLHAGGATKDGMFSASAMRERAATLLKITRDNTPFMNLWMTSLGLNTLVWHELQNWISPGYLKRSEQRQRDLQGTEFWLSPTKTDQWLHGNRPAFSPSSPAPLGWNLGG